MFSLIDIAYADGAAGAPPASGMGTMIGMLVVFLVFSYFLLWRPQNQRAKQHRDMLAAISKGDEIVTNGGIVGRVSKITDQFIVIGVNDNTEITVQKGAIASVLPKGTLKAID